MTPSDYLSRMVDGRLEELVAKHGRSPYRDGSRAGLFKVKDPSCYEREARRFGAALTALLIGTVVAACQAAPPPSTAIASTHPTWIAPTLQPPQPTSATPVPTATPLPSPQPILLPTPLPGVSVAKKTS